jgi:DNA-binding CsgD family transcriptional regulator
MDENSVLTPREQEILSLILGGIALKEIANKLGVSYKTVDYHRTNLYRKFGIQSMQELLVMFANKEVSASIGTNPNAFIRIDVFNDNLGSSISATVKEEKILKNTFSCYYIEGKLFDGPAVYAGIHIIPDTTTLEVMRKSTFFSFNILGDGSAYEVMLSTSDSRLNGGDNHFRKIFNTEKNKVSIITVNMNELAQSPLFGKQVPFIQSNVEGIQFQIIQSISKSKFKLKIWNIRFY